MYVVVIAEVESAAGKTAEAEGEGGSRGSSLVWRIRDPLPARHVL
jgi:hypothetical protein